MSPTDAPIRLRARFDGRAFVPETPVDVPVGTVLEMWAEPSATEPRPPRKAGSAKGLVWMRDDFDAPLDDFAEYM